MQFRIGKRDPVEEVEVVEFGELCRRIRNSLGITLEELARSAELEPHLLEALETGLVTTGVIPTKTLLCLAEFLLAAQYARRY